MSYTAGQPVIRLKTRQIGSVLSPADNNRPVHVQWQDTQLKEMCLPEFVMDLATWQQLQKNREQASSARDAWAERTASR